MFLVVYITIYYIFLLLVNIRLGSNSADSVSFKNCCLPVAANQWVILSKQGSTPVICIIFFLNTNSRKNVTSVDIPFYGLVGVINNAIVTVMYGLHY